jgi:hypothetical protein
LLPRTHFIFIFFVTEWVSIALITCGIIIIILFYFWVEIGTCEIGVVIWGAGGSRSLKIVCLEVYCVLYRFG